MNILVIHKNFLKAYHLIQQESFDLLIHFQDTFEKYQKNALASREGFIDDFFSSYELLHIKGKNQLLNYLKEHHKSIQTLSITTIGGIYERNLIRECARLVDAIEIKSYFPQYLFTNEHIKSVPENFTSFRKIYEPSLPKKYETYLTPPDTSDVKKRLDQYFSSNLPSSYFETRNALLGDSYSTRFSDLLAWSVVDPRDIYNRVKTYEDQKGANKSTYWIIFELLWREYFFHHAQVNQLQYYSKNGLRGPFESFSGESLIDINYLYQEFKEHQFFICALNELSQTGFLSNRVRQIFASIWINDFNLPWWQGARLFEAFLIDYDPFSNYGNWMYLAGLGVDPRGKRYFNLESQLDRYDPKREYLQKWS